MKRKDIFVTTLAGTLIFSGCSKSGSVSDSINNPFIPPNFSTTESTDISSDSSTTGSIDTPSNSSKDPIFEAIEEAEKLAAENKLERALIKIKAALDIYPDSTELKIKESEYTIAIADQKKAETLKKAKDFAKLENFEQAASAIKAEIDKGNNDSEYKAAYDM